MDDLPLQVAEVDRVVVHDSEGADPAAARYSSTGDQSASADDEHSRVLSRRCPVAPICGIRGAGVSLDLLRE
jgi:hypothetical protein